MQRKLDRRAAGALEDIGMADVGARIGDLTPTTGRRVGLAYRCDPVYTTPPDTATGVPGAPGRGQSGHGPGARGGKPVPPPDASPGPARVISVPGAGRGWRPETCR